MKLGIMQPYLFPYLGYFQLIAAVDKFVLYDDVAFIKQGWINRNQILLNGQPCLFSVPLRGASSNRSIRDTEISVGEYPRWRDRFLRTIVLAYSKAPYFEATMQLVSSVLEPSSSSAADLARRSIEVVCEALDLVTRIEISSTIYNNSHLRAQERVLDICRREGASLYINPSGGRELYSHEAFGACHMELRFLRSRLPAYPQFGGEFVPALSILDVLMFNSIDTVRGMLAEFDLEK